MADRKDQDKKPRGFTFYIALPLIVVSLCHLWTCGGFTLGQFATHAGIDKTDRRNNWDYNRMDLCLGSSLAYWHLDTCLVPYGAKNGTYLPLDTLNLIFLRPLVGKPTAILPLRAVCQSTTARRKMDTAGFHDWLLRRRLVMAPVSSMVGTSIGLVFTAKSPAPQ